MSCLVVDRSQNLKHWIRLRASNDDFGFIQFFNARSQAVFTRFASEGNRLGTVDEYVSDNILKFSYAEKNNYI